jgi:hypothetical protein
MHSLMQTGRPVFNNWEAFLISGGAVSWSSKKQSLVALSSTKAEYMAAAAATKEAVWLRTLLGEFNL